MSFTPPSQTVWGTLLQPAGCPQCKQAFLVEAQRLNQLCPNCARGALAPQPAYARPEPPELVVPPAKSQPEVRAALEQFVQSLWLRPSDFNASALAQRLALVYWPMWLVDGSVKGHWQAEAGFDYQVKSSQEQYDGGWRTRELVETRIKWEPRLGEVERRYDNIATPALTTEKTLIQSIGDYNVQAAQTYDPAQLRGAVVRVPDLPPDSAWPIARERLDAAAAAECAQAAYAQHIRNVVVRANYEGVHWTQLLLPLYTTFYADDDGQRHSVFVHAQSGRVVGRRMASPKQGWLWAGGIGCGALVFFALTLLVLVIGLAFPPLLLVGGVMLLIAIVIGLGAFWPVVWAWQWNQRQR